MKIRVIKDFYDKENDLVLRRAGTILEAGEDRADQLIGLGLAVRAEEKKQRPKKAAE